MNAYSIVTNILLKTHVLAIYTQETSKIFNPFLLLRIKWIYSGCNYVFNLDLCNIKLYHRYILITQLISSSVPELVHLWLESVLEPV